jgi:type I restriction enzyme M protein
MLAQSSCLCARFVTWEWGDTIGSPKLIERDALMKFDVVVANPPFSLDKWAAESAEADKFHRFHRACLPRARATMRSSTT